MMRFGRRGFVGGVVGVLTVAAAPITWVGRAFGATRAGLSPTDKVGLLFPDAAGTRRIGEAYLAVAPEENDQTLLFQALAPPDQQFDEWWGQVGVAELRRTIRKAAHADFAESRVVDLEGWQLATTECRLAALFTLAQ